MQDSEKAFVYFHRPSKFPLAFDWKLCVGECSGKGACPLSLNRCQVHSVQGDWPDRASVGVKSTQLVQGGLSAHLRPVSGRLGREAGLLTSGQCQVNSDREMGQIWVGTNVILNCINSISFCKFILWGEALKSGNFKLHSDGLCGATHSAGF